MASRFPPSSSLRFEGDGAAPEAQASGGTLEAKQPSFECDSCGKSVDGEPAGRGLFVWTRGEETRYEEPPLCAQCANAIGLAALAQWELEEDGE